MSSHSHAVVWIDHQKALIIRFGSDASEEQTVQAPGGAHHLHHKANSIGSGHRVEDQSYLHAVGAALQDAPAILVVGPGNEKGELVKHVERHDPSLRKRIVAVQAMDHPSPAGLLAHARRFFHAADRMLPQRRD